MSVLLNGWVTANYSVGRKYDYKFQDGEQNGGRANAWLYLKRLYFISSGIAYCIWPYASFYAGLSCSLFVYYARQLECCTVITNIFKHVKYLLSIDEENSEKSAWYNFKNLLWNDLAMISNDLPLFALVDILLYFKFRL